MTTRRRLLKYSILAGAAATAGATLFPRKANAYYSGPASDHFNGEQFFNPGRSHPQNFGRLLHLYFREAWAKWPGVLPSPFSDRPPLRVTGPRARVSFVGHASWLIQTGGLNLLVDPHWSDRASPLSFTGPKRANPPGIEFEHLPPIDVVLVTHNHYDHMDVPTLARLWARDRPLLVTPLGNDTIVKSEVPGYAARPLDWGDTIDLAPGIRAHVIPTEHWSARGLRDRRHALWASFILDTPAGRIYCVGDSGLGDGSTFRHVARAYPGVRLALLPIGAYEPRWFMRGQHMNPEDAVEALVLSGATQALGHHWGTFQLTTESHDQPPRDLAAALAARSLEPERFKPVQPGEAVEIG
jgi:L-ascorbate metabolism protein UlaG (beta-lactamase superfamily)